MKKPKESCAEVVKHETVKVEEQRAVARFRNPSRKSITKVAVDSCEMSSSSAIRCDYLVYSDKRANFVELKGTDVKHAIGQIEASLSYFNISREETRDVFAYVVCKNLNPILSTAIQNATIRFQKQYRARLIVKNSPLEAPVD